VLSDNQIRAAVDNLSGYIVAELAAKSKQPLAEVTEKYLMSQTFRQLSDPATGLYWDSLPQLMEQAEQELGKR
jgi:hypothetical protein